MPSLRDLDIVHRLNAPTRAAATRRRRLRKALAVLCLMLAGVIIAPGGHDSAASTASSPSAAARPATDLAGRHALVLRPLTPAPEAARVDVWNDTGVRLARCAPIVPSHAGSSSRLGSPSATDTVTVALTDAETLSVTRHVARSDPGGEGGKVLVSACL